MSKYEKFLSAAFMILLVSSALSLIYCKKSLNKLDARVESLNSNLQKIAKGDELSDNYIFKEQFKEDYYITQLDREMNLALVAIGLLFAGFGVIMFINFESRLNSFKENNEERHLENNKKYHNLRTELLELYADKSKDMAITFHVHALGLKAE